MTYLYRHIVTTIGKGYDYIWYIDSDATVSPLHMNTSIEEKIASWEQEESSPPLSAASMPASRKQSDRGGVVFGSRRPSEAAFIFFNNHPWRDGRKRCLL